MSQRTLEIAASEKGTTTVVNEQPRWPQKQIKTLTGAYLAIFCFASVKGVFSYGRLVKTHTGLGFLQSKCSQPGMNSVPCSPFTVRSGAPPALVSSPLGRASLCCTQNSLLALGAPFIPSASPLPPGGQATGHFSADSSVIS